MCEINHIFIYSHPLNCRINAIYTYAIKQIYHGHCPAFNPCVYYRENPDNRRMWNESQNVSHHISISLFALHTLQVRIFFVKCDNPTLSNTIYEYLCNATRHADTQSEMGRKRMTLLGVCQLQRQLNNIHQP